MFINSFLTLPKNPARFPYFTDEETEAQRLSNLPEVIQLVHSESLVAERILTRVRLFLHVVCACVCALECVPTRQRECEKTPGSQGEPQVGLRRCLGTQRQDTQSRLVHAWAASLCDGVFVCCTSVRSCDSVGTRTPGNPRAFSIPRCSWPELQGCLLSQARRKGRSKNDPALPQQAGQVSHKIQEAGVGGGDMSFARWG